MPPKIAILGWGSLITRPRTLLATKFTLDGPYLPIQFSRIAKSGSVTLVKDLTNGIFVQTWSALSKAKTLEKALINLQERELADPNEIGFIDLQTNTYRFLDQSQDYEPILKHMLCWCREKRVDAVIWTDLPPNFEERAGREWTLDNLLEYLSELKKSVKKKAQDYMVNIPTNVYEGLDTDKFIGVLEQD